MVAQNSAVVLVGRYSQTVKTDTPFSVQNMVAVTEFVKLLVCLILIGYDENPARSRSSWSEVIAYIPKGTYGALHRMSLDPYATFPIAIPAALYLFQNNVLYLALANLTAPVFQVTYQSKLVTTALVSVAMLNKRYTNMQWVSLTALGVGVAVVILGESQGGGSPSSSDADAVQQNMFVGLLAVLAACMSSAFAGVYFEKVLKGSTQSLWMRNVQLAFYSLLFSALAELFKNVLYPPTVSAPSLPYFSGFTSVTWTLVLLQAFGGLLVAAIVKHADNVVKGLATGVAVVASTAFSAITFGTPVGANFAVGGTLILASVWVFSNTDQATKMWESAKRATLEIMGQQPGGRNLLSTNVQEQSMV